MIRNPVVIIGMVLWVVAVGTFLSVHFSSPQPETGPIVISYKGVKLKFDHSDIDVVTLSRPTPFLRLAPDLGEDRSMQKVPYAIDLGRASTGEKHEDGYYHVGFGSYRDGEDDQTPLGDGYIMHCNYPKRQSPAFDCGVLLKTLPLAALEYRKSPANVKVARKYVDEAELFLKQSMVKMDD